MDVHKNAPLTPAGRAIMVGRVIAGHTPKAAAMAFGVCVKTVDAAFGVCGQLMVRGSIAEAD